VEHVVVLNPDEILIADSINQSSLGNCGMFFFIIIIAEHNLVKCFQKEKDHLVFLA
jgi:hypothetical protein